MPSLLNKSYTITAQVELPPGGGDGMIYNEGGRFFGYGLYLLGGKPVFTYNFQGLKRTRWEGPALPPGKHTIEFDFKYDGLGAATLAYNNVSGIGRGGTGTLKVDGRPVSTQQLEHTLPLTKPLDTVVNIGTAAGTPVDDKDYKVPFKFNGRIDKLTITLEPPQLTPEDVQQLQAAQARQAARAGAQHDVQRAVAIEVDQCAGRVAFASVGRLGALRGELQPSNGFPREEE